MNNFNYKRIADPVHKTIGLSKVEIDIIDTYCFQRLKHIKQLGLANYVYPGASFGRFEHCIGACHIAGRMLEHIKNNIKDSEISDEKLQTYRLAALLHDVGHYPFSHILEESIKDYYSDSYLENGDSEDEATPYLKHETVGKEIIVNNPEIHGIIEENGLDAEKIAAIFMRTNPRLDYQNLVSSDLDVDRLDYLLRTSHYTGLPYGSVDIDYLISQVCLDSNNYICFDRKTIRTIDHLLLSRYFDRLQVAHHKTVTALEIVLGEIIKTLLEKGVVDFSANNIKEKISSKDWHLYNDSYIMKHIKDLNETEKDEIIKVRTDSILNRQPPKLVAEVEYFFNRDNENFSTQKQLLEKSIEDFANKFDIDKNLWYLWSKDVQLTKALSLLPITENPQEDFSSIPEELLQAPLILNNKEGKEGKPIFGFKDSLMHILSNNAFFKIRLYVHLDESNIGIRDTICEYIKRECNLPFK